MKLRPADILALRFHSLYLDNRLPSEELLIRYASFLSLLGPSDRACIISLAALGGLVQLTDTSLPSP